jgi:prepilin-type N-terminal cleavage/methylation domain-containing protein
MRKLTMLVKVMKSDKGFTLMELIVAMFVAMLVTMGAATTFIVQNKVASIQEGTSDMQMSGQVSVDLMERDIRMAGYGVNKATGIVPEDNAVSTDPLRSVGTDAVFVRYSTTSASRFRYYVEKSGIAGRTGGLTRFDAKTSLTETIAGNVEDMQVVVTDDAPTGNKTVALTLLVKSLSRDPNYNQPPPTIGNGINRSADNFRRRVFTTNISARNYGF